MDLLKIRQSYDLETKILLSKRRIIDWYNHWSGQVYISFSGGKDSTVLLHLVRSIYPEVPAVFVDTGLEFPEIREFVKTIENVIWLKPKMSFRKVIEKYGYPVISKEQSSYIYEVRNTKSEKLRKKRLYGGDKFKGKISEKWKYLLNSDIKISDKCCDILKKNPIRKYEKESGRKGFIGVLAEESILRLSNWRKYGCNAYLLKRPISTPLIFWTEKNIWDYIKKFGLKYSSVYDKGWKRTGCIFCCFGVHLEKGENRFQKLYKTHRQLWEYCMKDWEKGGLGLKKVLKLLNIKYIPNTIF